MVFHSKIVSPVLISRAITMSSQLFLILSTILLSTSILLLLIKQKWRKAIASRRLPPGPIRLPLIGNLHQLGKLPHISLQRLANEHGPLMFLQLGSIPTLVVSSADMAREIFKNHDLVFSGRPVLYAAQKFTYNCSSVSFAPYGEYWREIRKIAILGLLSAKRVQTFAAIRDEEVSSMVDSIAGALNPINLSDLTFLLANNVVCRVAFGEKGGGDKRKSKSNFHGIFNETQDLLGSFCLSDFFPWMGWLNKFNGLQAKVEKNLMELDNYYDKVLDEHLDPNKPKPDHEDLVDVLIRVQKDPSQAITLRNEHIKGVLTDMFIAGTDTSSATLVWIMTELIRNPSVMRKVQNEVRGVAKGKPKVEESDLPRLTYLKMVIKEGLRLHPPVPLLVPRETTESCIVGNYEIPAKTRVFVNVKSIAMDPEYWENPSEFGPERFMGSSVDFRGQNFELIPFGAGRRICPGINFSIPIIELALANLLHSFDWSMPEGMRAEDIDMEEAVGITVHKKTPLCLVASPATV